MPEKNARAGCQSKRPEGGGGAKWRSRMQGRMPERGEGQDARAGCWEGCWEGRWAGRRNCEGRVDSNEAGLDSGSASLLISSARV